MMPGETHSAAPGTAADLSRCQGCASLQQVRRLPGPRARRSSAGRPGRGAGGLAAQAAPPRAAPAPRRKLPRLPFPLPFLLQLFGGTASLALFRLATQDSFAGMRGGGGGGVSEVWRAPSFTYPVSGLPGADFERDE